MHDLGQHDQGEAVDPMEALAVQAGVKPDLSNVVTIKPRPARASREPERLDA